MSLGSKKMSSKIIPKLTRALITKMFHSFYFKKMNVNLVAGVLCLLIGSNFVLGRSVEKQEGMFFNL